MGLANGVRFARRTVMLEAEIGEMSSGCLLLLLASVHGSLAMVFH